MSDSNTFQLPRLRPAWDNMIKPYDNTLAKNYDMMRNISFHDPYYAFVASYELQIMDYIGACNYKTAKQNILYNDGALGFIKGSPYTQLFNRM